MTPIDLLKIRTSGQSPSPIWVNRAELTRPHQETGEAGRFSGYRMALG